MTYIYICLQARVFLEEHSQVPVKRVTQREKKNSIDFRAFEAVDYSTIVAGVSSALNRPDKVHLGFER